VIVMSSTSRSRGVVLATSILLLAAQCTSASSSKHSSQKKLGKVALSEPVVSVTSTPAATAAFEGCSVGTEYNGKCYYHNSDSLSRNSAEAACETLGGTLASITSADMNSELVSLAGGNSVWIGLSDQSTEGTYVWEDGSEPTYTSWASGEPNDYGGAEDCVEMWSSGNWNDDSCSDNKESICELSTESLTFDYYTDTLSWDDAETECQGFGGNLVSITSEAINEEVLALVGGADNDVWIGLNDQSTEGTYVWVNGTEADYTNWGYGEPNDYGGGEDCVEMKSNGEWNDQSCSTEFAFVCQQSPTLMPTAAPTHAPTEAPTDAPTEAPTKSPTEAPTDAPTEAPTDAPTEAPTDAPTEAPTDTPTEAPTDAPTEAPTDVPTEAPTDAPTVAQTEAPTDAPTEAPTDAPTNAPTETPTGAPTEAPSAAPTLAPTQSSCNPEAEGYALWGNASLCLQVFTTELNRTAAAEACAAQGAGLAVAEDAAENAAITAAVDEAHEGCPNEANFWIGLTCEDTSDGHEYYWDGITDEATYFNWVSDHEDDTTNDNQECVVISASKKLLGEWNDKGCSDPHAYVCEYPAVTSAPTSAPTDVPTALPTVSPTEAPTEAPTVAPTEAPTDAPTKAPTETPTGAPTETPTEAPTATPTLMPTTATPTGAPTAAPTGAPTVVCSGQDGYSPYGSACLKAAEGPSTRAKAAAACAAEGAALAVIEDEDENTAVAMAIGDLLVELGEDSGTDKHLRNFWIGLTGDLETSYSFEEEVYYWDGDDEPATYFKWNADHSDDLTTENQDCVAMGATKNNLGTWNDKGCHLEFAYVCELLDAEIPEPPTGSYSYEEEVELEELSYSFSSSYSYSFSYGEGAGEEEEEVIKECGCPKGYTLSGELCLAASPEEMEFYAAERGCQQRGGHLLAIHSKEEEEDVISYLRDFMDDHPELPDETLFWIGLLSEDGAHAWTDNGDYDFNKFVDKEQELTGCGVIKGGYCKEHMGMWNTKHCWAHEKSICALPARCEVVDEEELSAANAAGASMEVIGEAVDRLNAASKKELVSEIQEFVKDMAASLDEPVHSAKTLVGLSAEVQALANMELMAAEEGAGPAASAPRVRYALLFASGAGVLVALFVARRAADRSRRSYIPL